MRLFLSILLCFQAAIDSVTRSLALEWGTDYDIRVNSIAPGRIKDTPGMDKIAPEEIVDDTQLKELPYRLEENWDAAMSAVYLASDAGFFLMNPPLIHYQSLELHLSLLLSHALICIRVTVTS